MAKDKAPPRYLMPGDDPAVDEVLARLRKDGEDGDPLYVDYRKRQRQRLHQDPSSAAREDGASEVAVPPTPEATTAPAATTDRPAEPQPVALPALPVRNDLPPATSTVTGHATPRWVLWGAFAIAAPVIAIAIGLLWSHHRVPSTPTPAASATVSAAPSVSAAASAPATDTTAVLPAPVVSAKVAPPVSATARAYPMRPHDRPLVQDGAYPDAGAAPAPTVTVAPSAAPAPPPPVRTQPEDNREF